LARTPVGVLIFGRGSNMLALAEAARDPACPYEIVLVGSNDPEAPGLAAAAALGLPVWSRSHRGMTRAAFDMLVDEALRDAGAEWVALAGYMRLLSTEFVARWRGRLINIHPSLLPRHKGLDTHARALEAGDAMHGVTVHLVTEALDDGPVLGQAEVPVMPDDTAETLAARVLVEEHRLYPKILGELVTR
jgi:phosphoribosylglycinamide formyltransferase 1